MSQSSTPKKRKRLSASEQSKANHKSIEPVAPIDSFVAEQRYILKALTLENGACPFEQWLKSIKDTATKQRVQVRLDRIECGNLGDCGPVGEGVSEFRLMFGPGYRIYYACVGDTLIVLLVGGDKGTQDKDIALAKKLWKDNKDDAQRYI